MTGCALKVSDFHQNGDEATGRFHLKGNRAKTKGIHFAAADAIDEYIKAAGIESGPLFRPRRAPLSDELAARRMTQRDVSDFNGVSGTSTRRSSGKKCFLQGRRFRSAYTPHSMRATTTTLLLEAREPIESVPDLLDHKHITTSQIYDKRRWSVRDSASQ